MAIAAMSGARRRASRLCCACKLGASADSAAFARENSATLGVGDRRSTLRLVAISSWCFPRQLSGVNWLGVALIAAGAILVSLRFKPSNSSRQCGRLSPRDRADPLPRHAALETLGRARRADA